MRVLIAAFILSLICLATAVAGEPIFSSKGVELKYDKKSGIYEVYKDGKLDSKRVIQNYKDIVHMNKLIKKLGGNPDEELTLTLNNQLMKSLEAPTEEQLVEVGVGNLELLTKSATLPVDQGGACALKSTETKSFSFGDSKKSKGPKKKGWFCAAPTEKELSVNYNPKKEAAQFKDDRTFMNHWLGGNVKRSVTLDTSNDNWLHGGGIALTGEQTADDRARTYGHALQYDAEGEDGSFRIRYSNNLFTKKTPREDGLGGTSWTDEGRMRLDAMEESTLFLRGTKNFDSDKNTYGVGSFSFRERTDNDRGSQSIQDAWHEMSGSVLYDYSEFMDDEYSLEVKAGVGKRFEGDLGKWKCRAEVEGLVGVDLWTMDRAEVEFNASVGLDSGTMGGREVDNPWLALDAYTRQSIDTEGLYESTYGAKVSTSFKWGESKIQPYMGVELIDEESDRMFQSATEQNELIHTIGVKVSF